MNLAYWDFFLNPNFWTVVYLFLNIPRLLLHLKTNVPFRFIGDSANGEFYTNKMAHLAAICKKQLDEQSS